MAVLECILTVIQLEWHIDTAKIQSSACSLTLFYPEFYDQRILLCSSGTKSNKLLPEIKKTPALCERDSIFMIYASHTSNLKQFRVKTFAANEAKQLYWRQATTSGEWDRGDKFQTDNELHVAAVQSEMQSEGST